VTDLHDPASPTHDHPRFLRSGEVATAAGVNVQTLRYYERRGLLAQAGRTPSGYRQYPARTVTLLRMIKNAQHLGFSLDEIAGLIANADPAEISVIAARKLAEIDTQIARLMLIREALAARIEPSTQS
jgi:MerR family transcriptional regulator, mercuric resistance operon regulatory protein